MERSVKQNDVILLLDNFSIDSQDLLNSFRMAGCNYPAAVIDDDGFLPDDVMSVYGFFLGDFRKALGNKERPKYFNEIVVPEYWQISGNNSSGEIKDLYRLRGKIFYAEPGHKRLVKIVDWYDERGIVRSSDHYNRYGKIYARTIFNEKGQRVNKSYFSAVGREIIVENFVTGDIILNVADKIEFFHTKTDFVVYFLRKAGYEYCRIFFNSLSTPFFVSNRLTDNEKKDVLFWQEPIGTEIPGNMQMIFNGQASRTNKIMVQKRHSYDKLIELGANRDIVNKLGFVYRFQKRNKYNPEVLICTNSDNIEHCREIVETLTQMHFYIVALTEMSSKLMSMGKYENVSLYPGIKTSILDEFFKKCDYYFDINHGAEIVSAVRRAFLHNQLIFAFQETIHNRSYIATEHIYPADEVSKMCLDVTAVMGDKALMDTYLKRQHKAAMVEEKRAYEEI